MEDTTLSTLYSIGAVNQLADALEKAGYSPDDVTKLKQFSNLSGIKDLIYGKAEIKYPEHLIDLNADPFIPEGWKVEEHKRRNPWKWNPALLLYLSKKQKKGYILGHDLRKELANKEVLSANVLDYLLAHPELIPEAWKGKAVFFWGTIYRRASGGLCVRCLGWDGSEWRWSCNFLDSGFSSGSPAALAS